MDVGTDEVRGLALDLFLIGLVGQSPDAIAAAGRLCGDKRFGLGRFHPAAVAAGEEFL